MTPRQAEALRLYRETGSKTETARRLGVDLSNLSKMLLKAEASERAEAEEPDRVKEALIGAEGADAVWLKSKGASILWRRPKAARDPMGILDALKAGLGELPRAAPVTENRTGPADLMAVFPVADLHIGLLTDPEETGVAWDTKIAMDAFAGAFARLVAVTPDAGTAILAQLGDLSHTTDQTNQTESGHQLDADTRFFLILRRSIAAMKGAIDVLRAKHSRTIYRGQRGNHDRFVVYAVSAALAEHYRDTPGVEIETAAHDIHVREFGRNLLAFHHGDKVDASRLAHFIAAEYPQQWGRTRHRLALSGHIHHETRKEVGGLVCESVGTIIPRDAWARAAGYTARRSLISITLDREAGEISRARVGIA